MSDDLAIYIEWEWVMAKEYKTEANIQTKQAGLGLQTVSIEVWETWTRKYKNINRIYEAIKEFDTTSC